MARRSDPTESVRDSAPVRIRFDRFELDEANARLLRDGAPVSLPPTPFAVLCALARQPQSLLGTNALLDQVWGHRFVTDSVLRTAISELRHALDDDARKPRYIETVSRRGYRFIGPAHAISVTQREFAGAPAASDPPVAPSPQGQPSPQGTPSSTVAPLRPSTPSSFVGRAEALDRLRAHWQRACAGERQIVWIAGEPGIGKTTLIDRFVAGLDDVLCVRGQCVEQFGSGEPYRPVLEALSELCRVDGSMLELLRAVAPTWLLQLPWFCTAAERDALQRELAGVGLERMLREMGVVLDRSSERRPLLVVMEDLHWSDRATLQLIDYVARRRDRGRLMWLASFRLAEVVALDHPVNGLRRELKLHGLCDEIVLDSFSESEVGEYVERTAPSYAGDEDLVRALHRRTDGLPLFVASVVGELLAGAPPGDRSGTRRRLARIGVPENLAAIVDHYIAKLAADERHVLAAAAVCGVQFRIETLAEVLERDVAWVGDVCDQLAGARLWLVASDSASDAVADGGRFAFRHALLRQVLYERTARSLRAQWHRRVGEALERERASGAPVAPAELAMHYERARELAKALRCYAEAADAALAQSASGECMSLTSHALALLDALPAGSERDALEIALATIDGIAATQAHGVASAEARQALQRAYARLPAVTEHPMRARLLHGLGFLLSHGGQYAEACALAERTAALGTQAGDDTLVLLACVVHAHADQLQGRSSSAREWIERGLAVGALDTPSDAGLVADPAITLLSLLAVELVHQGRIGQARTRLQQAHEHARRTGRPTSRLVALWFDALVHVRLGDPQRVRSAAAGIRELDEHDGIAQGRHAWQWFEAWADARTGDPLDAHRRIREACEASSRLGMRAGASEVRGYAAQALLAAGDVEGAERTLADALQFAETIGERVVLPQLRIMEAAVARARGRDDDAVRALRRAIDDAQAQDAPWLELLARTELAPSDEDVRALAALVDRLPEARGTAQMARAEALLGRRRRR